MNQILATENSKKEQKSNNIQENNYEPIQEFEDYNEPINNFESTYEPPTYSDDNNYFDMNQGYQSNNSYSNKPKKGTDTKKIIIIFAIIIIVFGLAIGGVVAFKMIKDNIIKNATPEVSIEEVEGNAKISAYCKKGIAKVTYYWNEEEKIEIPSTGENVEKLVELPRGENTLTVIVVDSEGNETPYTKSFSYYKDKEKPTIDLVFDEETVSLQITATDETEIAQLTYQWWEMIYDEDEEKEVEGEMILEKTIYPDEEGALTIEKSIEVQRGKTRLKIIAEDASGNTCVEEKPFNGVKEPEIECIVNKNNGYLYMIVSHDMGIQKIEYLINGEEFTFDDTLDSYEEEKQLVRRKVPLIEGENEIKITVYSIEEPEKTKTLEETYTYTSEE